jgi:hypothetical protein
MAYRGFVLLFLSILFCFALVEAKQAKKLLSTAEAAALGVGLTPFGYMPKSCVHGVSNGATILEENNGLTIVHADKTKERIEGNCNVAPLPSGWSVYGAWIDSQPLQYFGAAWVVPPLPQDERTQVLFLFNGLQNDGPLNAPTTIIQPVLQYGVSEAGGGMYWAIASWFVSSTGHAVYSKLGNVNAGDLLLGNMTNTNGLWEIVGTDTNNGASATISVRPGATQLFAALTLEVYQVTTCLEYPSGSTTFYDLVLRDGSGDATPKWTPNALRGCEEALNVIDSTAVEVKY